MIPQKKSDKPGVFRWNLSSWIGGQLGGTVWLLVFGILLLFHKDIIAGILITGCFLLLNAIGIFLWHRRGKMAPYPATQIFLALIGGLSALTITWIDRAGYFPQGYSTSYILKWLLIVPALMLFFHFQEHSKRKDR